MKREISRLVCASILAMPIFCYPQGVTGSIVGTVVDPASAVIPGAEVVLKNEATGASVSAISNEVGLFRFPIVLQGRYSIAVKVPGFKTYTQSGISISAGETRDLGRVVLVLGSIDEQVTVTAEVTPVQTASGEQSAVVTSTQLEQLALRGRDFLALMGLLPGVLDTSTSRETTNPAAISGISIQWGRANQKNFTVDGITALDTGSNATIHYEPNMDAIAEVTVLKSNYQAEYGRMAGGTIAVSTKSGTQDFHGTGYWGHRHEQFNANEFFRNRSRLPKPLYRYNIAGYSIGGPVYIPGAFNTDRSKLFFFWSQEYLRQRKDFGTRYVNMPTELERNGDFSRSFDTSGKLIPIKDPLTGQQFPGNIIPLSRINPIGQAILKSFPKPNYVDPDPALVYQRNYAVMAAGSYPRRNDVLRFDANLGRGFMIYYRFIQDSDRQDLPFGAPWGGNNYINSYVRYGQPGRGHVVHLSKTFGPTLMNEFSFGKSRNYLYFYPLDPSKIDRSAMGNPPKWWPIDTSKPGMANYIPDVTFGGTPVNPPSTRCYGMPYENWTNIYSATDNLSKVWGNHSVKLGIYIERTQKYSQELSLNYRGAFDFSTDATNPNDSSHSFANALLGNFRTYREATDRLVGDIWFWQVEWYAQDNWRIAPRFTLDYGLRFHYLGDTVDSGYALAGFDPTSYSPGNAPVMYAPGKDALGKRAAVNPLTGQTGPVALIGLFVPGTGNPANGMKVGGKDGYPRGVYTMTPPVALAPRFGFAYDVFGNHKTALRGGFGIFYNRVQGNPYFRMVGNPPLTYTPIAYYGNLSTFAQTASYLGPPAVEFIYGKNKIETTMNFSLGLQQSIGFGTVVGVSYVGSLGRHLLWQRNINIIPKYARFDPANQDPTVPGSPLPDNFFRPYKGYDNLLMDEFNATSNYNSMEVSVQRRFAKRLMLGVAYTWARALTTATGDGTSVTQYFTPREWMYGPYGRSHVMVINYLYELPNLGQRLGNRFVAALLDRWSISGITNFSTGSFVTPSWSTNYTVDTTGSGESARITVIGDWHLPKRERTFDRNFNTSAFAATPVGSFGNAGIGMIVGPGVNNWDISLTKAVPLGLGEGRTLQFRTEFYNAFNHPQFSSYNTAARFDRQGNQINAAFGAFSATSGPRIIAFSLRVRF